MGLRPLVVSLANSQEVLYVVNRPANRPSHDGAAPWIDRSIRWALEGAGFERVRLRGDTDFSLTANFDRWTVAGVEFAFGMDANASFVARAQELAEEAWESLERPQSEVKRRRPAKVKRAVSEQRGFRNLDLEQDHVAEIEYRPGKCRRTYRLVVVRKRIKVTEGQLRLTDETRHFFYVTNIPRDG